MSFDDLPVELIYAIITWDPLEFGRCECVCTLWKELLENTQLQHKKRFARIRDELMYITRGVRHILDNHEKNNIIPKSEELIQYFSNDEGWTIIHLVDDEYIGDCCGEKLIFPPEYHGIYPDASGLSPNGLYTRELAIDVDEDGYEYFYNFR